MNKISMLLTACLLSMMSLASYADENKIQSNLALEGTVTENVGSTAMDPASHDGQVQFTAPNLIDNPRVNNK